MKIIVTGITGFIGKNFSKAIADNENQYICLIRKTSHTDNLTKANNIEYIVTDFSAGNLTEIFTDAAAVIHMAGQMGAYGITEERFRKGNCELTRNVMQACDAADVKQLIYVSTPGVTGFGKRLSTEEDSYAPRGMYEQTKAQAEQLIIKGLKNTNVKYTILRPDFVYGPEDTRRIRMYKNIRDRKFVLTTSGTSHLCPTYIADVVQGINKSVGNPAAYDEIFNISSEKDMTVNEYIGTIASYFGVRVIHLNIGYRLSILLASIVEKFCNGVLKKDGFVSKSKIDFLAIDHSTSCEKAKELVGYKPKYNFVKGFSETMEWYRKMKLM